MTKILHILHINNNNYHQYINTLPNHRREAEGESGLDHSRHIGGMRYLSKV